jgi:hypothetical protein
MSKGSRSRSYLHGALQGLNNLLHLPVVYELAWYLYYTSALLLSPLLAPFMLLGLLYDIITLRLFSFRMLAPAGRAVLVTGCDSGFGLALAKALAGKGWKVRRYAHSILCYARMCYAMLTYTRDGW